MRPVQQIAARPAFAAAAAVGVALFASPSAAAQDAAARCTALAATAGDGIAFDKPELVAQGTRSGGPGGGVVLPEHCLVRGTIHRRTGAGGREYGIGFELRLPVTWNGRFMFQGGAGLDGQVAPAIGNVANSSGAPALTRGFAVVSTDAGHRGSPIDASFATDQQARIDYGYNALDKVTVAAKSLVARFYGKAAKFSYFVGCSNGGRQALTAAQRLPLYFDGIVAGDPSIRFSRVGIDELWNVQAVARAAPRDAQGRPILARAFSDDDLKLVRTAVLKRCDAKDGLRDGMINAWRSCDFDPAMLKCKKAKTTTCLSTAQVRALRELHEGPRTRDGTPLYGAFNYDTGIASSAWRGMRLGTATDGKLGSADATLGVGQLKYLQLTPPQPDFDPLAPVDYARLAEAVRYTAALVDADNPYLSTFASRGKMIVYNGLSDQGLASSVLADWYDRMLAATGADARDAVRLYLVPGMTHCGGGEATDRFEMLDTIVSWVENGSAPDRILASTADLPRRNRPLCPHPLVARYKGGREDAAESFACER